jgi:truncated hemoglobin YjbI
MNHPPMAPGQSPAPNLPRAEAVEISFGGFAFAGGEPARAPGLFALTRRIGDAVHPVLFGESENVALALEILRSEDPALARGLADGVFFMPRDNARQRRHILRDLVGKYNPPLNVEDRKARAAPEIAALVQDRAEADFPPDSAESAAEPIELTEDELDRLVRVFYSRALEDELIGPVFDSHVSDWEHHYDIVRNFWSRAMLGTSRYGGSPFAPHLGMNLKPEHFDRWVALFRDTATSVLKPAAARAVIARVEHMSVAFQAGLFPLKLGGGGHDA